MDLRQFVDIAELPPMLFERGYYLTPSKEEASKAYRLLAETMERTQRAGIATFVMREREYVVAIFAKQGILCAETLRFHDEIRDPETIGLPHRTDADSRRAGSFERSVEALSAESIPARDLVDRDAEALLALIEKKQKAGRDLVHTDHESGKPTESENGDEEGDVDLLETIRRSLHHAGGKGAARKSGQSKNSRPKLRVRRA
jgi:DNA end-binding protein Ku